MCQSRRADRRDQSRAARRLPSDIGTACAVRYCGGRDQASVPRDAVAVSLTHTDGGSSVAFARERLVIARAEVVVHKPLPVRRYAAEVDEVGKIVARLSLLRFTPISIW